MIPKKDIDDKGNEIDIVVCSHCGSTAKIHFAFPGTKEKDFEMSRVMVGVWQYIAYRCSSIILVGSSLDYDPVLLSFIRELILSRKIPLICISHEKEASALERMKANKPLQKKDKCRENVLRRFGRVEKCLDFLR